MFGDSSYANQLLTPLNEKRLRPEKFKGLWERLFMATQF